MSTGPRRANSDEPKTGAYNTRPRTFAAGIGMSKRPSRPYTGMPFTEPSIRRIVAPTREAATVARRAEGAEARARR
ncbi:hypothetical protein GA0115240_117715 [Streptomyces sp. DvalAA-14]|nr:hypothetical protein GA0115240_117715 [Streptomyces sp. DvalAA-14]